MKSLEKFLSMAPECDKRCGWCLSYDLWKCVNYEDTDYGTIIYTYRCNHYDSTEELVCDNETTQEFEQERTSA